MPLFEWNEEFSIEISSLDEEHKIFLGHINALYEAIHFGTASHVLIPLIDDLVTYSIGHFAHEEEYMFATHYPDFEAHKKAHEELRNKLVALQFKGENQPSPSVFNETFLFLKTWLTNHVLNTDKKMALYLREHGVS
ncbi:MAG: bacteriohemerythrin [Bdellovibrionales bacterium]